MGDELQVASAAQGGQWCRDGSRKPNDGIKGLRRHMGDRWSRFSPLSPKDGGTSDFNNLMVVVSLGRRETLRPRAVRSKRYLNKKNTEFWTCAGGISRLGVDVFHSECVVCHGRWLTEMITGTEDLQVISSKSQVSRVQNLFTNLTAVQWLLGKELEVLV